MESKIKRTYILYDLRAMSEGTDEATILSTGGTLQELMEDAKSYGGGVIYSYSDIDGTLMDERFETIVTI